MNLFLKNSVQKWLEKYDMKYLFKYVCKTADTGGHGHIFCSSILSTKFNSVFCLQNDSFNDVYDGYEEEEKSDVTNAGKKRPK